MKGTTVLSTLDVCTSNSAQVPVAGVGGLACVASTGGFLMGVSGKQLVGFMFPD